MIHLLVFDIDDICDDFPPKTAMNIEDYLQFRPNWKADINEMILRFDFLNADRNDDINVFGRLDSIIAQFLEIEKRLKEGKFAILRTDNNNQGCFYIFEPQEDMVYFSFLADLPMPYVSFYPQSPSPQFYAGKFNQQTELYNFIETNRKDLIPKTIQPQFIAQMQNVPFSKKEFLQALTKQISLANKLLRL